MFNLWPLEMYFAHDPYFVIQVHLMAVHQRVLSESTGFTRFATDSSREPFNTFCSGLGA